MNTIEEDSFLVPKPNQYVESALSYVGYARRTNGFLPHAFSQFLVQFMYFIAPSHTEDFLLKQFRVAREKLIKNGSYTPAK